MSDSTIAGSDSPLETSAGHRVIALALVGAASWLVYSALTSGSQGGCAGGYDADGGWVDARGTATTTAPLCTDAQLHSSPLIQWFIVGIVIAGIVVGLRIPSPERARRILTGAMLLSVVVAVACAGVAATWFWSVPLEDRASSPPVIGVAIETVRTTPMQPMERG